jgi:hypothetical protein
MSNSTVVGAPRLIRPACIAMMVGAIVGEFVAVLPAYSGDLYGYRYGPGPYYQDGGHRPAAA